MNAFLKKKNIICILIALSFGYYCSPKIRTEEIIYWNTMESMQRFGESRYKKDFFNLSNFFESQANKLFCGPTSATIVLNALRLHSEYKKPKDVSSLTLFERNTLLKRVSSSPFYEKYTVNNIFVSKTKSRDAVLGGLFVDSSGKQVRNFSFQLEELSQLLGSKGHLLTVKKVIVTDEIALDQIREDFKKNLNLENNYIIINYKRKDLTQKGGGHFSPIGAYHASTDSVLIMDVATSRYRWAWG